MTEKEKRAAYLKAYYQNNKELTDDQILELSQRSTKAVLARKEKARRVSGFGFGIK